MGEIQVSSSLDVIARPVTEPGSAMEKMANRAKAKDATRSGAEEIFKGLISPKLCGPAGRLWTLLRFGLCFRPPDWTRDRFKGLRFFVFREIAYLSEDGSVIGLGRSWIPFHRDGMRLLGRVFSVRRPRPVGIAIEQLFGRESWVELEKPQKIEDFLTPFRMGREPIYRTRRLIWRGERGVRQRLLAVAEEEMVAKELQCTD